MRNEVRIAGFGGQGVITIGVLLSRAAGEIKGMEVAQSQSYGPESRGGACKTDIIISDAEIDYIKPMGLEWLLSMSQPSLDKYACDFMSSGNLLIDSTLVTSIPARFTNVMRIPATSLAADSLGLELAANVVMFGAFAKLSGWVSAAECKEALKNTIPAKALDKNYAAFDLGYAYDF